MKLLLDEMLKKTAKLLRIFGTDTLYAMGIPDSRILSQALNKNLILVTRDTELFRRCLQKGGKCLLVKSTIPKEQLIEIVSGLKIKNLFPQKTRCPDCNSLLKIVTKKEISELVPASVLRHKRKYWLCRKCKKAYWVGGHWKDLGKLAKIFG